MTADLLADTHRSGVYYLPPNHHLAVESGAKAAGLETLHADVGNCADVGSTLLELGRALKFPDWYGANFDALNDCLTDTDWQPAVGQAIFISGLKLLKKKNPEAFGVLIEVFQAASAVRQSLGSPFWILLDTPATDISPLPQA